MLPHHRVLDVGIGTGTSLIQNKSLIKEKNLTVIGVDYNAEYIATAKKSVIVEKLSDQLRMHCISIYDEDVPSVVASDGLFDVVYFSGSFSLMPDPGAALRVAKTLLKPKGKIYITQTYQKKNVPFLSFIKPLLLYMTSVDFGNLTFEKDVQDILDRSGMTVLRNEPIHGSVNNQYQSAKIIVLRP